ncbi:unnamed protein product [Periconia digitata]|uniref:Uncharacterized protein n=1 Tax=Periconia digitata TaxID=1303443 RepID=A0A9W4XZ90_9PLEO|nr:unnamed protein product [Periconia digitata]
MVKLTIRYCRDIFSGNMCINNAFLCLSLCFPNIYFAASFHSFAFAQAGQ